MRSHFRIVARQGYRKLTLTTKQPSRYIPCLGVLWELADR